MKKIIVGDYIITEDKNGDIWIEYAGDEPKEINIMEFEFILEKFYHGAYRHLDNDEIPGHTGE